jgi:hypothetical protein
MEVSQHPEKLVRGRDVFEESLSRQKRVARWNIRGIKTGQFLNPNLIGLADGEPTTKKLCWTPPRPVAMADRSPDNPQDLRILVRIVSACTLSLWAFAGGLLIEVFLFS